MHGMSLGLPIVCFLVGALGAVLGAWVYTRRATAQLEALRWTLELAREKAERDTQLASLCVPQWVQQAVRLEFERLGKLQAAQWSEQAREQQRWQAEQDVLRRGEWQALQGNAVCRVPPVMAAPAPVARPQRMPVASPTTEQMRRFEPPKAPLPTPVAAAEAPERELSDAEIDALPPDLPAPARPPGKKLPAPKARVLRNI
ncbi:MULTISPECIES: hypothetical protein [unclassified Variovorax]|uniref:hypothetical protein n=1 Tax=unclassified Variovorax TaxID=663243 RepID=UPI0008C5BE08|nr:MULTISPECIES: hypothetical protein [unclassified Variovorax]SEJ80571.1 hypothetical protein SAMN05518853_103666 [Variovorax sp. OK202]SFC93839.1 hypothetical protein SAMN05444746_103666 [Variovorax sp. OK212]